MSNNRYPFYDNWSFLLTKSNATIGELDRQKLRFKRVELPHDWLIYDTKNLYKDGCGWYTKEFEIIDGEIDDLGMDLTKGVLRSKETGMEHYVARIMRGEKVLLRFEGVYMDSTLYVNGKKIGDWKYGYSTFEMDITKALVQGKNRVTLQVRFRSPNSRWYSGAGIFRKVYLKVCPAICMSDESYVHTRETEGGFDITVRTELAGRVGENYGCTYRLWKGEELVKDFGWIPEKDGSVELQGFVEEPLRWDIDAPNLYHLTVDLCSQGKEEAFDSQKITVGFRTLEFTTDKGLFLNGKHVKIHGVCEHHDLGCLGAAFRKPAMARKIRMLQSMGVNAIRTSHNMPAAELMDLADEMGILILSEAFDMWERPKTEFDYARFFDKWCEKDVSSWVRRDRNHPSLLMWSIGNEIYDTHADAHGQDITRRLAAAVRQWDPLENAPISIGSNYMPWEGAQNCADILKTAGYNYGESYYAKHHAEHPDWVMYGSETASLVSSRGIYHFPLEQSVLCEEDEQCSSLGNSATSWGARSWEKCITDDRDADYIWGQFIWTGFDYIGEPTPYHTKNSYFGQIDTAGFPKDAYYVFRAEWTDYRKAPMVHLFPYWDFNPGQMIDVRICSNAPEVELFVNGVSKGRQSIDHKKGLDLVKSWKIPYEPGTIEAAAYDEAGREIARDRHVSFGDSRKIVLSADRQNLTADGEDLSFVTISTLDELGNPVENAADYVHVSVEGPGRILGMDNGDSTDYDRYKTTVRKLFSGKLLVVIGSTNEAGEITVKVEGNGLESARLTITTDQAPEGSFRQSYLEDCVDLCDPDLPERVPVRKIELTAEKPLCFTEEEPRILVEAKLLPANTTDRDLVWKVVNRAGIEVNCVKITSFEENGSIFAKLTAVGDGEFYVRCSAKNGEQTVLYSQLEGTVSGFGKAFLDPYEFVSAGLYSDVIGEVGNGNEKGISTARDGISGAVYDGIDFGEYGSDEITLSVFALSGEPHEIEFWMGKPGEEGSCLVDTLVYQKPSIWNVYQDMTFKLPRRVKGAARFSFVLKNKIHMKGFRFRKLEKAYGKLLGSDASAVYGDNFVRRGDSITGIGNNVTITFDNMDFGPMGASQVAIGGFTPLAANTSHIVYTDEQGKAERRMVEFVNTGDGCKEQTFTIQPLRGKGKIELVFLPGSQFDLESVQFFR